MAETPGWVGGLLLFTTTPTPDDLPEGYVGLSLEAGVTSLHVNNGGTIETLALGEPAP